MIEKGNIRIRAMERSDLRKVHEWRNNPYFRQFFREHRELTMDHKLSWFENMNSDDRFYMFVVESLSEKVIGVAFSGAAVAGATAAATRDEVVEVVEEEEEECSR